MGGADGMGGAGGMGSAGGAPGGSVLWTKVFEEHATSYIQWQVSAIVEKPDGNIMLGGRFVGDLDIVPSRVINASLGAFFTLSLDSTGGSAAISKLSDTPLYLSGIALQVSSLGDVFAVTGYDDSVGTFSMQIDRLTAPTWSKYYGNHLKNAFVSGPVSVDGAGNVITSLRTSPMADIGFGFGDAFFVKYNAAGAQIFSKLSYSMYPEDVRQDHLATDSSGNIFALRLNDSGTPLYTVAKFNPLGGMLWSKNFGESCSSIPLRCMSIASLLVNSAGQPVLVASIDGTWDFGAGPVTSLGQHDMVIITLDSGGNTISTKRFGAPGVTFFFGDVRLTGTDSLLINGEVSGPVPGIADSPPMGTGFIVKLDASGNTVWHLNVAKQHQYFAYTGDAAGGAIVASHDGELDLGAGPPLANVVNGLFVSKLAP